MAPGFLLLLLWLQGCVTAGSASPVFPSSPALRAYKRIWLREGETLSVQCSYKGHKTFGEDKVWCKITSKKCEPLAPRPWVPGPSYRMQDDVHAKVITVTMVTLRWEDAGRYWCMRGIPGVLYPLEGFLLEVSPGPGTVGTTPLTDVADEALKSRTVFTTGSAPSSSAGVPFTSGMAPLTPGPLPRASFRSAAAAGTPGPDPVTVSSLTSITATVGPRRTVGPRLVTVSPSETSSPVSASTSPGSSTCTSGTCHDQMLSTRLQEPRLTVLALLLSLLPASAALAALYRSWKRRHGGSYSLGSDSARPWTPSVRTLESLLRPAWPEAT